MVGFSLLAVWQWSPAVRDVIKYIEDPAAKSDYFEPLRQFLATLPDQRRIEVPFTRSHWEGDEVAESAPLARGWLRQLDTGHNELFYEGRLTSLGYASWLAENAVRVRGAAQRQAGQELYQERADRERAALPAAALALGQLACYGSPSRRRS